MQVTGIIRPPPDIRAVADKTALFVAKNGRAFEQRILNSGKGQTPKFAFLHESSPFHAYYEDKIKFYEQGGTDEKKEDDDVAKQGKGETSEKPVDVVIKKSAQQGEKKSVLDPIAKALIYQRNLIRAEYEEIEKARREDAKDDDDTPSGHVVTISPPPALHYVNITAPSNLTAEQVEIIKLVAQFIAIDESKNFLQNLTIREWNNPMFAFLQPRHSHFAYFSALTDCYKHIVQIALKDGFKDMTIEECLNIAAYRTEYDRDAAERHQGDKDEEQVNAAIDWHDFVVVETIDFPKDEIVQPLALPIEADTMELSDDEGENIRVVPNYTPKVVASSQTNKSRTHVIDPITGKSVPAAQTSEHMRIQLLDPKWAEERKKFQDKQKETNLVAGEDIAANLSRVIGESSGMSQLHADPRKRLAEANRVMQQQGNRPGPTLRTPEESTAKRQRMEPPPPPPFPPGMPPGMPHPSLPPPGIPSHGMPPVMPLGMSMPGIPPPPQGMPPTFPPPGVAPPTIPSMPPPIMPLGMPPVPPSLPTQPFDLASGAGAQGQDAFDQGASQEDQLIPAAEFAASLELPVVNLEIAIPHDPSNLAWNFCGQTVSLKVDVMSTIKDVKKELAGQLNDMAVNKMQLKHSLQGFLKDSQTLADFNLGPLASLEMVPKTRGGRK